MELRAYYFTLNNEKENFDPLSTNFKGVFRERGKVIEGELSIRSYEDFIAVAVIGEGNVTLNFEKASRGVEVGELKSREVYLIIAALMLLLAVVVYLEKKMG